MQVNNVNVCNRLFDEIRNFSFHYKLVKTDLSFAIIQKKNNLIMHINHAIDCTLGLIMQIMYVERGVNHKILTK